MNQTLTLSRRDEYAPLSPEKYDLAVFIGRFQPWHCGHESIVEQAFEQATNVLILIGSAHAPRSHRNPFTYDERVDMIFGSLGEGFRNLYCQPLEDSYNDEQWVIDAQRAVEFCLDDIAENEGLDSNQRKQMRVALIGHAKDHTSYYLNMFPAYESISAPNHKNVNSTQMRNAYFSNICEMWLNDCDGHRVGDRASEHLVPSAVRDFLIKFSKTDGYKYIRDEYEFILNYKKQWSSAPYPVTMVTTDAVVTQSGHVLLIRRRGRPGKGTWALPGGYIKQDEKIVDSMIRELVEETKIGLSKADLKKHITGSQVFDDPNRDPRGRVITHAFLIELPARRTTTKITNKKIVLEYVEGADDAELAKWFPFNEVKRETMFADHYAIFKHMLRIA